MRAVGRVEETVRPSSAMAWNSTSHPWRAWAVLLRNSTVSGIAGGASLGALVGIGIWLALMSVTFIYESRKPALFFIDGGYHVLALIVAGAILGAWPPA